MKKESFTSFMKQVAADLQQSGNLGTAHVYRSSLNAILVFQESESVEFREITPEWLKHFEGSLRARGCSWNTVSTYLRTMRAVYNRAVDLHRARTCRICSVPYIQVRGRTAGGRWIWKT